MNNTKIERIIVTIIFLAVGIYGRYKIGGGIFDTIAALSVIVACNNLVALLSPLKKALAFIGVHSSNIFMLHTFIYYYFFQDIFLKMPSGLVALIVLVALSLVTSIIIEKIKEIIVFMYGKGAQLVGWSKTR